MCEGNWALCFAATLLALWVIMCWCSIKRSLINKSASKSLKPTKAMCVATELANRLYVQSITVNPLPRFLCSQQCVGDFVIIRRALPFSEMESISDLIESYDAADGKSSITALKELLKELRRSKVGIPSITG